jgi:acyl-CoA thioesterase FadM
MRRVKIKFPDRKKLFSVKILVRVSDINYGGHVGNDSILSIVHESRMQFLVAEGYSELNAAGNGLIMADTMIAYKGESFYGDTLTIDMFAEEISDRSFDLLYRITTSRDGVERDIAHVVTGMVCFDYASRKPERMTLELKALLEK